MRFPALLTVIAPRHPARAGPIAQLAGLRGLQVARRSQSAPVLASTDVYLCDTIGDLGLLYRLGGPVFLGKSLAGSGGQNPVEAALLGNAIVHGPAVQNFAAVYHQLDAAGGALCVADAPDLQAQLATLLTDAATREIMALRAAAFVHGQRGATDAVMAALQPLLAAPTGGRNA